MNEFEHEEHDEEPSAPQQPPQHIEAPVDALGRRVNLPEDEDLERALRDFDAAAKSTPEPEQEQGDLLEKALSEYELSVLQKAGITEASSDYDIRHALAGDMLHKVYGETRDRLLDFAQHLQHTVDMADFNNALKHVRERQPASERMSDKLISAFLVHEHNTNMSFKQAWQDRYNSPGHWQSRLEKAAAQLGQQIQKPIDEETTSDLAAVAQLIRHGTTKHAPGENPLPKNLTSMSNAEYARFMKESFGINSRV